MKILHIGQLVGGLDIYIRNSIKNADEDIEYVVVHGVDDRSKPVCNKNGVEIKEYKISLFRNLNILNDFRALWQAYNIVKKERPDVIHCHSAKGGFVGRIVGFMTGVKTFYTPHAFSFMSSASRSHRKIYLLIERFTRMNCFLLACSESERNLGIKLVHYNTERALCWENAVPDIEDLSDVTSDYLPSAPYICFCGRPSYQKNPSFMLELVKSIHEKYPQLVFLQLGVGYYSPDLHKLEDGIRQNHLEKTLILVPWLSHAETLYLIKKSLFYYSVSRYEGLPLSVIEAMALGKAIVASDVTGNKDCVKNDENGYLLKLDLEDFKTTICKLIESQEIYTRMGERSRELYEEKFFIGNRIDDLMRIYKG